MGADLRDEQMRAILREHRAIAVVGLSPKTWRPSHDVAAYMARAGYRITPVNPRCDEVLGVRCVPDLPRAAEQDPVEIVNVFRRAEAVPPVVDEAIAVGARAIWMQLGIVHDQAAEKARAAGIAVVMDRCIKIEHARLLGTHRL